MNCGDNSYQFLVNDLYHRRMRQLRLDEESEHLRQLLQEIRRELGVTQVELAERLDVPQSFVSKYETGERQLEFVTVEAVCRALGLGFGEFVGRWEL